ncbi:hypothetical protein Tco_1417737 [Tanacetum coccineum]
MCILRNPQFSDDTLNDVRSALSDILKQIQMEYLPETVWRKVNKERELWSKLLIDNSGTEGRSSRIEVTLTTTGDGQDHIRPPTLLLTVLMQDI